MQRRKKSLLKALSFLVVFSILLSLFPAFPPVVKTMATNFADKRDGVYEGGSNFSEYKGVTRDECARSYGVYDKIEILTTSSAANELSSYAKQKCQSGVYGYGIKTEGTDTYYIIPLNVEATIDRGYAIYGIPEDVADNFTKAQPGFKQVSTGYFWASLGADEYYHLSSPGNGVRGYFRYWGFSQTGAVQSDEDFPPDRDYEPVASGTKILYKPWQNSIARQICAVADSYKPSNVSSNAITQVWSALSKFKDMKGQTLADAINIAQTQYGSKITSASMLADYAMISNATPYAGAQVVLVLQEPDGWIHYRTYDGIPPRAKPQVTTDSMSYKVTSQSYLVKNSDGTLKYDPAVNYDPVLYIDITGKMTDYFHTNRDKLYYKAFNYTRDDVTKYAARITSVEINGRAISLDVVNKDIEVNGTREDKKDNIDITANSIPVMIPKSYLTGDRVTVKVTGLVKVIFNDGESQTGNTKEVSVTINVQPSLQQPQLQLSVVPAQSEVTVTTDNSGNLVYTPSSITHTVKPVKVSNMTVPAGFKVKRLEFVIDKDNSRVASATTPDYSESYNTTATTITSFSQSSSTHYSNCCCSALLNPCKLETNMLQYT